MTKLNQNQVQGTLIKGIGGFYYVEAAERVYECKARGSFRKEHITPLVGDHVIVTLSGDESYHAIEEILPRKNSLRRPPVANLDQLFIVVSSCEPTPNALVIDRLTAMAVKAQIKPIILLNKADLKAVDEWEDAYQKAGFPTLVVSGKTGQGTAEIRKLLAGKTSAFTGNSGVGKSTLLNALDPSLGLPTQEISQKLGRGKHTTRECTLLHVADGYVADTPGFASLEFDKSDLILKEDLPDCFPEFLPYLDRCQFYPSCRHLNDKGCAVRKAVEEGKIAASRYGSYRLLYEEVKDIAEWQLK